MTTKDIKKNTRTASERLEALEHAFLTVDQTLRNTLRAQETLVQTVKLLGSKLDAVVKLSVSGNELNDANISKIMVDNSAEELKGRVDSMIQMGLLAQTTEVDENSFVVLRLMETGTNKVINPRVQFGLFVLKQELKDKVIGKKVGESFSDDDKTYYEIQEVYDMVTQQEQAQA